MENKFNIYSSKVKRVNIPIPGILSLSKTLRWNHLSAMNIVCQRYVLYL